MINGFLLAIQFFTSVPIRKSLPIGQREAVWMFTLYPAVGALIGLAAWTVCAVVTGPGGGGSFLAAFAVVLVFALLSGGLHLDGWADTGDAYFSYRDREKRLEIMADPRIGAFGTMALLFLLIGKLAVLNELIARGGPGPVHFLLVPFAARAGLALFYAHVRPAKGSGLLAFLKGKADGPQVGIPGLAVLAAGTAAAALVSGSVLPAAAIALAVLVSVLAFGKWSVRNFGGATGDHAGAFVEGCEGLLWTVLLFFT
ncbi:adenosylcobinamide-GDP ribazoletransferase [Edaphobacillus lindanitolerans]|uniref:Adenosylcobinamide-GDP ribazoletransferase n=1 Tax=Edaphobacillus lindanitolerans TaxID=550447 RepID=A0A1U7PJC7_9BACI|nr:adenosylcobinamide-GDP ribazoletransferase [Edaphobacillus lindanitolerans]SIT69874.1 cobalamin-5'-phosphate synthase [Edaphobacillus lindanitolerans]